MKNTPKPKISRLGRRLLNRFELSVYMHGMAEQMEGDATKELTRSRANRAYEVLEAYITKLEKGRRDG